MRSAVRPGRYGLGSSSGICAVGCYETEEGDQFTVSEDIEAEDTKFDGFHTSTMNRVLVTHALWTAGDGGQGIRLITGLPVADFYFDGDRDVEMIERPEEQTSELTSLMRTSNADFGLNK